MRKIIKLKMSSMFIKIFIGIRETEEETVLAQHSHRLLVFIPGHQLLFPYQAIRFSYKGIRFSC